VAGGLAGGVVLALGGGMGGGALEFYFCYV